MNGHFPLFHTREDTPERATAPFLMERVYEAVEEGVRRFLESREPEPMANPEANVAARRST